MFTGVISKWVNILKFLGIISLTLGEERCKYGMAKEEESNNEIELRSWTGVKDIGVKSLKYMEADSSLAITLLDAHSLQFYTENSINNCKKMRLKEMAGFMWRTREFQRKLGYLIVRQSKEMLPD